jgi:hypothetical protein
MKKNNVIILKLDISESPKFAEVNTVIVDQKIKFAPMQKKIFLKFVLFVYFIPAL